MDHRLAQKKLSQYLSVITVEAILAERPVLLVDQFFGRCMFPSPRRGQCGQG